MSPLRVRTTLWQAAGALRAEYRRLVRAAVAPLVGLVALQFLWKAVDAFADRSLPDWMPTAIYTVPIASFSVAVHRRLLKGIAAPPGLGRTEIRFAGCLLLLGAPFILPFDELSHRGLAFGLLLVAAYVVARLSLVLPAIAVGSPHGLMLTWRQSARTGLALLFITTIASIAGGWGAVPLMGAALWLSHILPPDSTSIPAAILSGCALLLVTAVEVAALSMAYRTLMVDLGQETPDPIA